MEACPVDQAAFLVQVETEVQYSPSPQNSSMSLLPITFIFTVYETYIW